MISYEFKILPFKDITPPPPSSEERLSCQNIPFEAENFV